MSQGQASLLRLLVVDDDLTIRTLLRAYFERKGFIVDEAGDGHQAERALREGHFDLVLLDMMMPGMTGLELLELLKRTVPESLPPVVMLTAIDAPESVVACLRAGARDYIAKPFSLPLLSERIQRLLAPPTSSSPPLAQAETEFLVEEDIVVVDEALASPAAPGPHEVSEELFPSTAAPPPPPPPPDDDTTAPSTTIPIKAGLPRSPSLLSRLASLTRRILPGDQPQLTEGFVLAHRYCLQAPLGAGAFGAVWRARHLDLDRDVALKVLHRDAVSSHPARTAFQQFQQEAVLAARVESRHAVRVLDFGRTTEGHAFMAMELLPGRTLRAYLAQGPLTVSFACGTCADVCDALAFAHRRHVVHRDVKSLNVILTEELDSPRPLTKLVDFGAAISLDDILPGEDADGGVMVGTPSHMAPERFDGDPGSPQSDVYAVGIMLFQLLTGDLPFLGPDVAHIAEAQKQAPLPALALRSQHLAVVDDLLQQLLDKRPERRPSALSAAAALRTIARSQPH